jgi:hypothetical protein
VRFQTISGFDEVTKSTPEKSLLVAIARKGGRNNHGRITAKRRGGGHRKQYRIIDFKRQKDGIPAKVVGIEYDPNRSARIAGIPSFCRLKSIIRYCFLCPPPRLFAVIRPWLLRPPFLAIATRRLFSGVDFVTSSNPEIVWNRTPGDLGLAS